MKGRIDWWKAWDDLAFGFVLGAIMLGIGIVLGILLVSGR